jgi:hypothetical protein
MQQRTRSFYKKALQFLPTQTAMRTHENKNAFLKNHNTRSPSLRTGASVPGAANGRRWESIINRGRPQKFFALPQNTGRQASIEGTGRRGRENGLSRAQMMVTHLQHAVTSRLQMNAIATTGVKRSMSAAGKGKLHHLGRRLQFVILNSGKNPAFFPACLTEMVQIPKHYFRALAFCHMKHANATSIRHVKPDGMCFLSLLGQKITFSNIVAFFYCRIKRGLMRFKNRRSENGSTADTH